MRLHRVVRTIIGSHPRRTLAPVAIVAAFLLTVSTPGLVFAWSNYAFSSTDENLMVTLVNNARASAGLPPYGVDATLHSIAEQRAKYIYDHNCTSHYTCPAGSTYMFVTLLKNAGYCYTVAGENYGFNNFGDSETTTRMFNWWMGLSPSWSPADSTTSHKANILGTGYTKIGVGAFKGDGRWGTFGGVSGGDTTSLPTHVFVQIFAHPCSSATPTPTPKPTASPTPKPSPTATPRPTPTPTPRPTGTPGSTPPPTPTPAPGQTASSSASPDASASPSASPSPDATAGPISGADPFDLTPTGPGDAWRIWRLHSSSEPGPVIPTPSPTPEPTPGTTPPPAAGTDLGLQVVDPVPDRSLLDAIVGGVVSSYFGQ